MTQTQYPPSGWTSPHLTPEPQERRLAGRIVVVAAFVAVMVTLVTALFVAQQSKLSDERDKSSDLTVKLEKSESTVERRDIALGDAASDVSAAQDTLAECALVVEMSDHQYEQGSLLLDALDWTVNGNVTGATDKISEAGEHIDRVNSIMKDNGYDSYEELWNACAADYDVQES